MPVIGARHHYKFIKVCNNFLMVPDTIKKLLREYLSWSLYIHFLKGFKLEEND